MDVFEDTSHLQLSFQAGAAGEIVGGQKSSVVDAFDLKVSAILLAQLIAQRLPDNGPLFSLLDPLSPNADFDSPALTMLPASVEPRAQTKMTFPQVELRENSFSVMLVRSSWRVTTSRGRALAMDARARAW